MNPYEFNIVNWHVGKAWWPMVHQLIARCPMLLHTQRGICFSLDTFILGDVKKTIPQNGTCTKPYLFCPESLSHFTQSDNPYDSLGFRLAWNQPLLKLIPDFGIWLPQISQGASTEGREKIYAWGIQRLKSESTFFLVFVLHVRGKPGQHFQNRISELHRMCSDRTIYSYL